MRNNLPTWINESSSDDDTNMQAPSFKSTTFALAQKYDRLIDVHCDEIDDEQSRFVETVAALAHREGMGARVTASL